MSVDTETPCSAVLDARYSKNDIQTERDTMSQHDAQMTAKEQIRVECLKLAVALFCAQREDLTRTPENVVEAAAQMAAMVEK